ncbi:MAG TPA: hypothetical protein VFK92_02820 [Burkholderiales bacterium]|nr:hypothetical protein [Burkholderiales bacterium]
MTEMPDGAVPERTLLQTRSDYQLGFGRVLGLARRELRIFDPDLSELEMNSAQRVETLSRFLRGGASRRVLIALHDVDYVSKRCPRFIALLGVYASSVFIYRTTGDAAKVQDCFVLADADHLVRRPVTAQPRGVLVIGDPKECQPMRERFDEIWESSEPAVSANTTGL